MSQAKVDRYKEEKRNRAQIMKKQKRDAMLMKAGAGILGLAIVAWAGISVYQTVTAPEPVDENAPVEVVNYTVDTDPLADYMASVARD